MFSSWANSFFLFFSLPSTSTHCSRHHARTAHSIGPLAFDRAKSSPNTKHTDGSNQTAVRAEGKASTLTHQQPTGARIHTARQGMNPTLPAQCNGPRPRQRPDDPIRRCFTCSARKIASNGHLRRDVDLSVPDITAQVTPTTQRRHAEGITFSTRRLLRTADLPHATRSRLLLVTDSILASARAASILSVQRNR